MLGTRIMSTEMSSLIDETVVDHITCPHCKDFIKPPSWCCENGHFVCHECKEQISKCPLCDTENYPNKSNSVFDMILRDLYYPCLYQENGCPAYFKPDEMKHHQKNCQFRIEPCIYHNEGCPLSLKPSERSAHENQCTYGIACRIYAKIKSSLYTDCNWKGLKKNLLHHVTTTHQLAWCPHQIESNVALSWMLPMNIDFEKVELIHLKDLNELFYFYSKSIANSQHFIAVQYIGNHDNWKQFMYSLEFSYEDKKLGFENLVLPYNITGEEVYSSNYCFSVYYELLRTHFFAERVIDCYVKIFKKPQKLTAVKKYFTYNDGKLPDI